MTATTLLACIVIWLMARRGGLIRLLVMVYLIAWVIGGCTRGGYYYGAANQVRRSSARSINEADRQRQRYYRRKGLGRSQDGERQPARR